jgi:hypothetical protein
MEQNRKEEKKFFGLKTKKGDSFPPPTGYMQVDFKSLINVSIFLV